MKIVHYDEMKKTWHQIARHHDGGVPSSFELEVYKKLLDVFHVGDLYYYILNIAQVKKELVSDQVQQVLGGGPGCFSVEYIFDNLHPEDKDRL